MSVCMSVLRCSSIRLSSRLAKTGRVLYRNLYTEDRLSVPKCRAWRKEWMFRSGHALTRMRKLMSDDGRRISGDDLRNYLAVVDETHLDELENVLKRYHRDGGVSESINCTVARVLFILNQPERAASLLLDKDLATFFSSSTSYAIVMQLLFNAEKYAEVLELFEHLNRSTRRFPIMCVTLVLASHHKLNRKPSLSAALGLLDDMYSRGMNPIPRHSALVAHLALKQGRPDICWEVTSPDTLRHLTPLQMGNSLRSLQIISLTRLGRGEEALSLLRLYNESKLYASRESVDELMTIVSDDDVAAAAAMTYDQSLTLEELVLMPMGLKSFEQCEEARASWREKALARRSSSR